MSLDTTIGRPVTDPTRQTIGNPVEVILARRMIFDAAVELLQDSLAATKVATAASELARNVLEHGGGGYCEWCEIEDVGRRGLYAVFTDEGVGISDVDLALSRGYTTSKGMGVGLPGAQRLVDDMRIHSEPGAGTSVEIVKWM